MGALVVYPIEHYRMAQVKETLFNIIYSWCNKSLGKLGKMLLSLRKEFTWN